MNQDIKKRWVEALRSGKYKQGKERLKSEQGFCCLGVLCDLAVHDGVGQWNGQCFTTDDKSVEYMPPQKIKDWSGLRMGVPLMTEIGLSQAHVLNDQGISFEKIADLIEEQL